MNTQIQKGLAEPYGYRSLANAVEAELSVQVPSQRALAGVRELHSLSTRGLAGAFLEVSAAA